MPTNKISISSTVGGISKSSNLSLEGDGQIGVGAIDIPAAKVGALTTRTDDNTGVITSNAHGIADASVVDVYWDGGSRFGMLTSGATANTFAIDGGAGDVLPADESPITVMVQVVIDIDFDGDLLVAVEALLAANGHVGFRDAAAAEQVTAEVEANNPWLWWDGSEGANPLAGEVIGSVVVSQAGTTAAAKFRLGVLYDATP